MPASFIVCTNVVIEMGQLIGLSFIIPVSSLSHDWVVPS